MLRSAYYGQELLSTFGTTIGEIALIPATGGVFTVQLTHYPSSRSKSMENQSIIGTEVSKDAGVESILIWDRKTEAGFPETKVLKQRIRDHLEPGRDLGHSDTPSKQAKKTEIEGPGDAKHVSVDGNASPVKDTAKSIKAESEQCADCG